MLKDSGKAAMSSAGKAPKPPKPVMLCRLCHCEFTNFKEHVKSLVHLDARETKVAVLPTKQKSTNDNRGDSAKRAKTDDLGKKSSVSEENNTKDESGASKEYVSPGDQPYSPFHADDEDDTSHTSQEDEDSYAADLNGNGGPDRDRKNTEEIPHWLKSARELKDFAKDNDIELTAAQKTFLFKTWRCKLCAHVHRDQDDSFDEHAEREYHKISMERRISTLKSKYKFRTSCQWLMNCLACSFFTNDKELYIAHLQSAQHDKYFKEIMGGSKDIHQFKRACTCFRPITNELKSLERKRPQADQGNQTKKNKANSKPATPQEDKSAAKDPPCRIITTTQILSKKVFPQPFIEKSQASNTPGNATPNMPVKSNPTPLLPANSNPTPIIPMKSMVTPNIPMKSKVTPNIPMKSNPAPLMSINLKPLVKTEAGWLPTSTVTRPPNNQPGLLGEYRPHLVPTNFGFEGLNQDDPFELIAATGMLPPSLGVGMEAPPYADLRGDFQRQFDMESYGNVFGAEKLNPVWTGQNSIPHPTEKLNSLAFGAVEPDPPPASEFDTLSKLFTQQPGLLPSNVSLDLATNSSIRYKQYDSDRGAMFDNYPTSRPDISRNKSSRESSRTDHFSRPMFSRR